MTYTGRVRGGVVVFDGPPPPDGTAVTLTVEPSANGRHPPAPPAEPDPPVDEEAVRRKPIQDLTPAELTVRIRLELADMAAEAAANPPLPPIAERWPRTAGRTVELPEDASQRVDHYLKHGLPKR